MKTLLLSFTYFVGISELILAIFFWTTHSKNEIRKVMAVLAFSTGIWVILSAVTSYVSMTTIGYYEMAFVFLFGAVLILALLHLSLIMPYPVIVLDKLHKFLFYAFPLFFFSYALFFSRTIVESFDGSPTWAGIVIGGPLYSLYNLFLAIIFFLAVGIIFSRIPKLDGLHRKNMQILGWSVFLGGLPPVILYLILPNFVPEIDINPLFGVISSFIWVGGTSFIILKK